MSLDVAKRIVDFAYSRTPSNESIDFAFFGGEPLIEFELIKQITSLIEAHSQYDSTRVQLTFVSNGTLFNDDIAQFVRDKKIAFGISCDGSPEVHDLFRRYPGGNGSSHKVEQTLRDALKAFGNVMVNAVYRPESLDALPQTIEYFSSLGLRQIYLSPDYSAQWTPEHASRLTGVYGDVAALYQDYYHQNDPHFISLIDSKIAVILRGGYQPQERCSMGRGELAFTPDGAIYPCERLVGNGDDKHCIGHIDNGINTEAMQCHSADSVAVIRPSNPCDTCGLQSMCMHWCGCSNYFGSGYYDRASAFLCASERAAITCAAEAYKNLEADYAELFFDHATGSPLGNSVHKQA